MYAIFLGCVYTYTNTLSHTLVRYRKFYFQTFFPEIMLLQYAVTRDERATNTHTRCVWSTNQCAYYYFNIYYVNSENFPCDFVFDV